MSSHRTPKSPTTLAPPDHPARRVRFRYNHIFLPEYVSTVLISLAVSALFMSLTAGGQRPRLWTNPHAPAATAVYLLVACGLLAFIMAWNNFLFAFLFTTTNAVKTLPVMMRLFAMGEPSVWGVSAAGAVLTTLPVALIFLL